MTQGKICVVGNGPSATRNMNGAFIDSCDQVVRIGNCDVMNFSRHVGSKTTIYAGRWKKLENNVNLCKVCDQIWLLYPEPPHNWNSNHMGDESISRNDVSIARMKITKSKIKYIPSSLIDLYKTIYTSSILPKVSDIACGFNIPASGNVVVDMVVDAFPGFEIYITGFDGYFLDTTYYFDRTRKYGKDFTHSHDSLTQFVELKKSILLNNINVI